MSRFIDFQLERIDDPIIREQFQKLLDFLRVQDLLLGKFSFFQYTFDNAVSNFRVPHGLGFLPKDFIITSQIGAGNFTVNYNVVDTTFFDFSTTGAVEVRLFAGRHQDTGA